MSRGSGEPGAAMRDWSRLSREAAGGRRQAAGGEAAAGEAARRPPAVADHDRRQRPIPYLRTLNNYHHEQLAHNTYQPPVCVFPTEVENCFCNI